VEVEKSHLEGSKNIPMGDVPTRANQELDPGRTHCRYVPPRRALLERHDLAAAAGFEKVQSMRGGIDGWARTVDPKVPLY